MNGDMAILFLMSSVFLILGMGLFTLGADIAMVPMGEAVGSAISKSKKIWLIIVAAFLMGLAITVAEPDLTVLAQQVPMVPNRILIYTIGFGVGFFLVVALLRIVLGLSLRLLLAISYLILGVLAFFIPSDVLSVAFDSGGVTTGPVTVPFMIALGIGVASVRTGPNAENDSFGIVALCSVGPIIAVLFLGLFFDMSSSGYTFSVTEINGVASVFRIYGEGMLHQAKNVALALSPIVVISIVFQIFLLKLPKIKMKRIGFGLIYTYLGLVLFLTSVNVGFLPVGNFLGGALASLDAAWKLLLPAMVMGFFVVAAEPAIHVLKKQVEEITVGAIPQKALLLSLSIGVSISLGLAMVRVLTGLPIWYILIPGYGLALLLTLFVPKIFTAIAFDSGGVASGPMTATFLLPFSIGACAAVGGNIITDAFGLVAMVALTPLITVQLLGLIYVLKTRRDQKAEMRMMFDGEIIEFEIQDNVIEVENNESEVEDNEIEVEENQAETGSVIRHE
ncbi:hypothetical protein DSECCO2_648770 [anaerobic digester metagenome]